MTDEERPPVVARQSCPRCHRPVDPFDANAVRNPDTRRWQHRDCRTKPRGPITPDKTATR